LAVLRKTAEVPNVNDTVQKYEQLIHRTICQLVKLDFYQQHLDMVASELRLKRRQSEGLKRFEAVLGMPVGYYWGGKCSLLIDRLRISDVC